METLKVFKQMLGELEGTNSSNEKLVILEKYKDKDVSEYLKLALDPYLKYHLSSDQLEKHNDLIEPIAQWGSMSTDVGLKTAFMDLNMGAVSGHDAIARMNWITQKYPDYKDVIYRILDKDLKCRVDAVLVNKVFFGLIPEYKVALAQDYFKQKKVDLETGLWKFSHKLDGVRTITEIRDGKVSFFSREGHEFFTLDVLRGDIEALGIQNGVLDGELCLLDEQGNESFQGIIKLIRKKDFTIPNPAYRVFDFLTLEEFTAGKGTTLLMDRIDKLVALAPKFSSRLDCLRQYGVSTKEGVDGALTQANSLGWEGIILRKNVGYEGKRSKNMLKVKSMMDGEFVVVEAVNGLVDDGKGKKVMALSSVVIEHKGFKVGVGSGFSFADRLLYYNQPELIVGKVIGVKYFNETTDQYGDLSLRFPIFKGLHGDKREV